MLEIEKQLRQIMDNVMDGRINAEEGSKQGMKLITLIAKTTVKNVRHKAAEIVEDIGYSKSKYEASQEIMNIQWKEIKPTIKE